MLDYLLISSYSGHTLFTKLFTTPPLNLSATINHVLNQLILQPTTFNSFPQPHTTVYSFINTTHKFVILLCRPTLTSLLTNQELVTQQILTKFNEYLSDHVLHHLDSEAYMRLLHLGEPVNFEHDSILSTFMEIMDQAELTVSKQHKPRKTQFSHKPVTDGLLLNSTGSSPKASKKKKKPLKQLRSWDDSNPSASHASALDFSESHCCKPTPIASSKIHNSIRGYTPDQISNTASKLSLSLQSAFTSLVNTLTNTKTPITAAQLTVPNTKLKSHLIAKNVPLQITNEIVDNATAGLIGQLHTTNVMDAVNRAIHTQVQKVLSTSACTDLLADIRAKKLKVKDVPYVIVFCGVNGVGKSTNLAKVAFWLLQNDLRVLVIGGDSFRSGAVEQLRVHVQNLNTLLGGNGIALFERGYGVDAALVARDGIKHASTHSYDVVLVDTAGRMQNNEPLMRSLAKLITLNDPDKVVFVGEALVGNESIDQISKFNSGLQQFSTNTVPHTIDAMILTKFDIIRDKVGTAIGMAYITGKPILFVGTGQTYTDLKRVNVDAVVDTLLSD